MEAHSENHFLMNVKKANTDNCRIVLSCFKKILANEYKFKIVKYFAKSMIRVARTKRLNFAKIAKAQLILDMQLPSTEKQGV